MSLASQYSALRKNLEQQLNNARTPLPVTSLESIECINIFLVTISPDMSILILPRGTRHQTMNAFYMAKGSIGEELRV